LSTWVAVFALVLYLFFAVETLWIGPDGIRYLASAIVPLWRRSIPLDELKGVMSFTMKPINSNEPAAGVHTVRLVTVGRPLDVCQNVKTGEQLWLVDLLERHLKPLAPNLAFPYVESEGRQVKRVQTDPKIPPPPSDSRVSMSTDWDGLLFRRRGQFNPWMLAGATFVNLFWNGMVGIFIFQLFKSPRAHEALELILIPFVATGLGLIFGWLWILTASYQVKSWTAGPDGVTSRFSVFGLGRSRRIETSDIGRLELRKNEDTAARRFAAMAGCDRKITPYSLTFVDRGGRDALTIGSLTEGEARCMGGHFAEQFKEALTCARPAISASSSKAGAIWDRELDS
jgi:hypothetical protein